MDKSRSSTKDQYDSMQREKNQREAKVKCMCAGVLLFGGRFWGDGGSAAAWWLFGDVTRCCEGGWSDGLAVVTSNGTSSRQTTKARGNQGNIFDILPSYVYYSLANSFMSYLKLSSRLSQNITYSPLKIAPTSYLQDTLQERFLQK